jgi:hypothetical protein
MLPLWVPHVFVGILPPKTPKGKRAKNANKTKQEKQNSRPKPKTPKFRKSATTKTSRAPAGIIAYTHTQILHFRLRSAVGRKQKTAKIRETPG